MKTIAFTDDESLLLQNLLNIRLNYCLDFLKRESREDKPENNNFEKHYIIPIQSVLNKLLNREDVFYNKWEKSACVSCINEHYQSFLNKLKLSTPLSWLTVSEEQREVISQIDNCKNVLSKCGYYSKNALFGKTDSGLRYGKVLETFNKLAKSDKIFLWPVGENRYYKIDFIYENKESFTFELTHKILFNDFYFASFKHKVPNDSGVATLTTKNTALELFTRSKQQDYPEGVHEFITALLRC